MKLQISAEVFPVLLRFLFYPGMIRAPFKTVEKCCERLGRNCENETTWT